MKNSKIKNFSKSINDCLHYVMSKNKNVICLGLGATDPKGIFGTTLGLEQKFGSKRVFDIPASENAITGICVGASILGTIPVLSHQRVDFALLSMDQIVNNASKIFYMFGEEIYSPITIRMIIGRGWGQGPTHSQNLQSIFAHFPGLKVVMPSFPEDAKTLLYNSILDPNPVIFLEHRWLHNSVGKVNNTYKKEKIGKAKLISKGKDITIISSSYMTLEAIKAIKILNKNNISCDLIDLRSIKPIDFNLINKSISKTKNLLCLDTDFEISSISSYIISKVINQHDFKNMPTFMSMPDVPEPTSYALTKNFYNDYIKIIRKVSEILKKNINFENLNIKTHHDVPDDTFKGPF